MRCFFALPVLGPVQRQLESACHLEAAPALHLTLQFIGNWPADRTDELIAVAAAVVWHPFPLEITGLGTFPRILWAGVEPSQPLLELVRELAARLAPLGIHREERPFTPHITLARLGKGAQPPAWASASSRDWGRLAVAEFCFYETVSSAPPQDRYQVRARFPATSSIQAR